MVAVILVKQPTFDALTAAGMTATLPHYPHRAGDSIDVEIAANTDGQALNVWVMDVSYDVTVLTYISASTSSHYIAAVVTEPSAGLVSMSTSGMKSSTTAAAVTGSDIDVITLTFEVKEEMRWLTLEEETKYGRISEISAEMKRSGEEDV